MLLSFDGVNGSGHTTLITKLIEYYTKQNKECLYIRGPGIHFNTSMCQSIFQHLDDYENMTSYVDKNIEIMESTDKVLDRFGDINNNEFQFNNLTNLYKFIYEYKVKPYLNDIEKIWNFSISQKLIFADKWALHYYAASLYYLQQPLNEFRYQIPYNHIFYLQCSLEEGKKRKLLTHDHQIGGVPVLLSNRSNFPIHLENKITAIDTEYSTIEESFNNIKNKINEWL